MGSGVAPKTSPLTTMMYIKSLSCMYSIVSFKYRSLTSVTYNFLVMDLLAILQKSLDRALTLYIFIHEVLLSGVRPSISIVHIRKFHKI